MRARDARSSACARSFAIDCAARSAKLRSRISASAGNGSPDSRCALKAPTSSAWLITGQAIVEPRSVGDSSERVAIPVSRTASVALPGTGRSTAPGSTFADRVALQPAATTTSSSPPPHQTKLTALALNNAPTSEVIAPRTSCCGCPPATRVATRRSADCSATSAAISRRASAFAIAWPTSAAKSPSRCSAPGGNGSPASLREAVTTPQTRPSSTIGAPIEASMPSSSQRSRANSLSRSARELTRPGAPLSTTRAVIVSPPYAYSRPGSSIEPSTLQSPSTRIVSTSQRITFALSASKSGRSRA